jgi:hypothetical protein
MIIDNSVEIIAFANLITKHRNWNDEVVLFMYLQGPSGVYSK